MSNWVELTSVAECQAGQCGEFVVAGHVIALFCVDGEFFALDGICPHQGGSLGKGTLQGNVVTCPWHGWQFDVCQGTCLLSPEIVQPSWQVKVENDKVYVDLTTT